MFRTSKYNAKKVEIDGIKFDSKAEGEYYLHLKRQEGVLPLKAQAIKEFKRVNKIQKGNLDEWKKYIGDVEND